MECECGRLRKLCGAARVLSHVGFRRRWPRRLWSSVAGLQDTDLVLGGDGAVAVGVGLLGHVDPLLTDIVFRLSR